MELTEFKCLYKIQNIFTIVKNAPKSAESRERNVLALGSLCHPAICETQRKKLIYLQHSIIWFEFSLCIVLSRWKSLGVNPLSEVRNKLSKTLEANNKILLYWFSRSNILYITYIENLLINYNLGCLHITVRV